MHTTLPLRIAVVCALAVTVGAMGFGPATAAPPAPVQADIEYGNNACGGEILGAPTIGTAIFLRKGNQVTVTYRLTDGDPDSEYEVFVHSVATCDVIGTSLGTFTRPRTGKDASAVA